MTKVFGYDGKATEQEVYRVVANETPFTVSFDGRVYFRTGKVGNRFDTGEMVFEMATDDTDERVWANADASTVWMD